MNIHIVTGKHDFESDNIQGVFEDETKANGYAQENNEGKTDEARSCTASGSVIDADFKGIFGALIARSDDELFNTKKEELQRKYFHFRWDESESLAANLYTFTDMLELYRRSVRRWEENSHGSCCVVERVRDEYLMPEIMSFLAMAQNDKPSQQDGGAK